MSELEKLLKKKKKAIKTKERSQTLPVYDMKGRTLYSEQSVKKKKIISAAAIIAGVIAFIYIPSVVMVEESETPVSVEVEKDQTAIRLVNSALRDNPTGDFDGDGIENADEISLGTDPWNIDTDADQVTDYYEVNVLDSDPLSAGSALLDAQTKQDESEGKNLGTPYKIGNVILWPDDYHARAYGSVVEIPSGYRFCGFSGYAQFSEWKGGYAYKVENGIHTLLPYRETEDVWRVTDGDTVEIFEDKLDETIRLSLFSKDVYLSSNAATKLLDFMLPDRGFITSRVMTTIDVDPDISKDVLAEIEKPVFSSDDYDRFMMNSNTLNDLLIVQQSIEENGSCIAVSLYNGDKGEYLGIIYGYTSDGDLLVADMDTLEPVGTIYITEKARKILDNDGDIVSNTYFDYFGLGFDSEKGDRISFFATSEGEKNK